MRRRRMMAARPPDEVCLTTYLTSRTLAHWRVTAGGASRLSRAGSVPVIAFHPEERRVLSRPRSIEAAKSHVVREGLSIERVRVVNRSREDGLIYAAPVGYLDALLEGALLFDTGSGAGLEEGFGPGLDTGGGPGAGMRSEFRSEFAGGTDPAVDPVATSGIGAGTPGAIAPAPAADAGALQIEAVAPGLMLVDRLLARAGENSPARSGRPFAVLVDLCAPEDEASESRLRRERLVIAVVLVDAATQPAVVCSVTDEPVKDIARLVLYEQKLSDDAPWILFNAADVLAAAPEVACYPAEPEWSGMPTRRIANGMLAASVLLALFGAGYAVDTLQRLRGAEAATREAREQMHRMQQELGALMRSRPGVLASELSLDPLAILDRAATLWRAGARVAVDTRGAATEYTVSVPFSQARMSFQNRPSAHSVTERARVAAVLAIDPPAGCARSGLRATGALNEVSLVVRCENPDSALARFLPR